MNIAAIKKYCASLPHVKNDLKWGVDHAYTIGAKMFAVAMVNREGITVVSFKVDADLFLPMSDRPGFIPAPYLARAKWVQVTDLAKVSDQELKKLIRHSYDLITAKLTKKLRAELGIIQKVETA